MTVQDFGKIIKAFLLRKSKLRRTVFFILGDGLLLSIALYLAFYLRFDGNIEPQYINKFLNYLLVFLSVKYIIFAMFRLYHMSWSYVGFYELFDILKANTVSLFFLLGIIFMLWSHSLFKGFPRSIPLIDYGIALMFIAMFRSSKRFYGQIRSGINQTDTKRTLIIGAGNAGEQIVRDMRRQKDSPYVPIGFIDDDVMKQGVYIQGVKVQGNRENIARIVEKLKVDLVLLAIPSASSRDIRSILSHVRESSVKEIKTIPGFNELVSWNISLSDIKEVRVEDIIGREQVSIDKKFVNSFIQGKTVLVTGAGGSIGSELVRQILAFEPKKIIALDIDETEMHHIELELSQHSRFEIVSVVADVRDRHKIETVFNEFLPDVVFHAAAYKHVPMMEKYPEEAVRVNIFGTKTMAETAIACETKKFVLVSTDKAVKPTNIMGATKQVAEKIVRELNSLGKTRFISVRFGNVVGSRGSVIPTFEEQIRRGGPVTVTHQEMKRYFMSVPEACILILQAAAIGKGGEVFHLDMGEQIKIVDIAKELIRLNGLEPDIDIPIVFTGIRPGEKLYEELLTDTEGIEPTVHPKIFIVKDMSNNDEHILKKVMLFENVIQRKQWAWIRNLLKDFVPTYNPSYNHASILDVPERSYKIVRENMQAKTH
ncbi:MAG: nucleoside-diphosphate sugar epimerase/dehydratase [Nitrospirota bacterium]